MLSNADELSKKSDIKSEKILATKQPEIKESSHAQKSIKINNLNVEVVNNLQMNNSLMVDFDKSQCKFTLYDKSKNLLGSFSNLQIIKYLTMQIDPSFLQNIDAVTAIPVIETYICKVIKDNGYIKINLLTHLTSPFMGNIEMILKLYQGINNFENTKMNLLLNDMNNELKKKIIDIIKQFVYLLLNHSLKLIATISDFVKDDQNKKQLKETLLKYSVSFVYKISSFMKNEMENILERYRNILKICNFLKIATF